jgi:2-phosphosulfolactate phosphatase
MKVEVLFTPAEFEALPKRDLRGTVCVVFDVLRATSSIITALANGATAVYPVATIPEALALKTRQPSILLAGERDGFRITAKLTGSIDFDLGNSPREFLSLSGKAIAMTTTNGTRALNACRGAREILAGSFLNLARVAEHIQLAHPASLLLVCSGTHEEASYEDLLGAGALADALWSQFNVAADSAHIARNCYLAARHDLLGAMQHARNARRLLSVPELKADVAFCLQRDVSGILAHLDRDGQVVTLP